MLLDAPLPDNSEVLQESIDQLRKAMRQDYGRLLIPELKLTKAEAYLLDFIWAQPSVISRKATSESLNSDRRVSTASFSHTLSHLQEKLKGHNLNIQGGGSGFRDVQLGISQTGKEILTRMSEPARRKLQQLKNLKIPEELPEDIEQLKTILGKLLIVLRGQPEDIKIPGVPPAGVLVLSTLLANSGMIVTRELMNLSFPFWLDTTRENFTVDAHISRLDHRLANASISSSTPTNTESDLKRQKIKLAINKRVIARHIGYGWSISGAQRVDLIANFNLKTPTI